MNFIVLINKSSLKLELPSEMDELLNCQLIPPSGKMWDLTEEEKEEAKNETRRKR